MFHNYQNFYDQFSYNYFQLINRDYHGHKYIDDVPKDELSPFCNLKFSSALREHYLIGPA